MLQKKILVLLGPAATDLKSMHYALSLAERLHARVYIFRSVSAHQIDDVMYLWLNEAISDLVASARSAGLSVTDYISDGDIQSELTELIKTENIDFMIFSPEEQIDEPLLHQLKSQVMAQFIQVKEKHQIHFI